MSIDLVKIKTVQNWPQPQSVSQLKGFLGFTRYYRRFVKGYGVIYKPLTTLLKKNQFKWSKKATDVFQALKVAMVSPPILALPNFSEEFILKIDACGMGIEVVLMQGGHPVTFISNALSPKHQALSIYKKKLLAIYM